MWKCSTRSRRESPQSQCTLSADHFYSVSHPKPFTAPSPLWVWCYQPTAEGVPQLTAGRPSYADYLPLFRRGSAPVSMTTWSLLCSVGLDIQSVAGEGCRGVAQQMHFPQQDALLLPGTGWKLVRQRTRWWEPPFRLVSAAMPKSVTTCLSRARWLLIPAYFF